MTFRNFYSYSFIRSPELFDIQTLTSSFLAVYISKLPSSHITFTVICTAADTSKLVLCDQKVFNTNNVQNVLVVFAEIFNDGAFKLKFARENKYEINVIKRYNFNIIYFTEIRRNRTSYFWSAIKTQNHLLQYPFLKYYIINCIFFFN